MEESFYVTVTALASRQHDPRGALDQYFGES
jgi:hypothetical protein